MLRKVARNSLVRFSLNLVLVGVLALGSVWSQGFQGTIRGSVQDQTGALIPNAEVRISNTATGESRSTLSSSTGTFNFPNLLLGTYTVTVELQGFKRYSRENVQVSANSISDVIARLEVGAITEEISVTAGEDRVQTSTAQLQGFTTRNIVDLPNSMLTGEPNNFAILAPGTTTMPGGMAGRGGSIGGNRPRNNNFVVDGVDNNDPSVTGPLTPVISEAVEEFTLLTNQFSAEYGHSTAGQFITTTKSGSNEIHGRAWWYNQNRHTNSLDNTTRATTRPGDPKPRYDWNRFGGQVGGPIMRDKWFYFGSYEYRNLSQAGTASGVILVPTQAGLSTLQSLASTAGTGISPVNVGILAEHVPVAGAQTSSATVTNELTGAQVTIPLGQFRATTPQFDRTHLFLINSDFNTAAHRLSGRFSYSKNPFVLAGPLPIEKFNSNASNDTRRIVFTDVWTMSPTVVNEFRAGYNRNIESFPVDLPAAPGRTDVFGNYSVTNLSLNVGPRSNFPQLGADNLYQFANNTSIAVGAHTLKFGAEVRNIISKSDFLPRVRGEFTWPTLDDFARDRFPASVSIRGVGLGAFTQNRTGYHAYAQDSWKVHPRVTFEFGARYEFTTIARDQRLQDLNGIASIVSLTQEEFRPNINLPANSTDPRIGQRIFPTLAPHHQAALLGHVGDRLLFRQPDPDRNNVSPRIGLAWDLTGDGKTSIRAGAAIATDVVYGNLALLQLPPQVQAENRETNACTLAPSPAWCSVPGSLTPRTADIRHSTVGFLGGGGLLPVLPPATRINPYTARTATGNYVFPDETAPETYTWSLSLQREQFQNWLFEARYVGNHAVHLPVQAHKNPATPAQVRLPVFLNEADARGRSFAGAPTLANFASGTTRLLAPYGFASPMTVFVPDGQSWYHGGSISVEKRMSQGLQFNTSYTWSKTIDLIENDLFTSFFNPRRPLDHYNIFANKGLSGMHREHKFVLSWVYDIPGMDGSSGRLSKLTNGWQLNGIYVAESGQPVSIISFVDMNGDGDTAGDTAFFNPAGQKNVGTGTNFVCWNGSASSIATSAAGCGGNANVVGYVAQNPNAQYIQGQQGMVSNLGRNTFLMPGINNWNLGLSKKTAFWGETRNIEFKIDLWNAFNHPSFTLGTGSVAGQTTPATSLTGYITPSSSQFLDKTQFSGSLGNAPFQRIIQWGLKLNF